MNKLNVINNLIGPRLKTSTSILLVVMFSSLGFYLTYYTISKNIVQYGCLPKTFNIKTADNYSFSLPVHSKLPIDTIRQKSYVSPAKEKDCSEIAFHQNPFFMLWVILICITVAIAAGAFPFFIAQAYHLKKEFALSNKEVWLKGIIFALIICFFLSSIEMISVGFFQPYDLVDYFHILFRKGILLKDIVKTIILLILPGLVVMFLTGASSDKIYGNARFYVKDENYDSLKSIEKAAKRIKLLNGSLQSALQILATVIVFSSLSANALGKTIKATVSVDGFDLYPSITSYIYGMFFSLFLCIIYLPNYYYLKNNYNRLKELAADLKEADATPAWYTSLFGEIKFEGNALENIKMALTIIAPLLTSFLPNIEHLN